MEIKRNYLNDVEVYWVVISRSCTCYLDIKNIKPLYQVYMLFNQLKWKYPYKTTI